ncbi:hypothetical protein P8A21_15765 [Streptomyces poriferorum]|uniref:Uncharacterized protein n=1 Tax=Streptomyces poriferorum TaxID=2798799 RepID=A0ABY9ISS2_9ACTN|nr:MULTISPECIES: hypothetical protein [unclassified Streptomyces]MDP5312506.1 hypothetical protein [Streptomyces sp. Alt4]WLQ48861.1 hypothetical protein P8A21_15765 [Streptomyces sp. Alt1]WLQ58462.1 hypothetical protein P8A19_24870 [Streptomyces sp. Alt2]
MEPRDAVQAAGTVRGGRARFAEFGEDDKDAVQQLARVAALREDGPRSADEVDFRRLPGLRERAGAAGMAGATSCAS